MNADVLERIFQAIGNCPECSGVSPEDAKYVAAFYTLLTEECEKEYQRGYGNGIEAGFVKGTHSARLEQQGTK
jgi:hypothetical protein